MATLERFGAYNDTITVFNPSALNLRCTESDLVDIATELQYNRSITSLNLSHIPISVEAAAALGKTLGDRSNRCGVQHLKLNSCQLNASCVEPLAEALSKNTQIEVLDIASNPVRDEGAVHLAKMLETNTVLRTVDFGECKIGPTGSAAIAGAISVNKRLRTLVLRNNKLREAGVVALCKGMKSNNNIVVLDISGNSINREGGMALADLLKANKTLESINFGKNFLSDSIPYIASAMCHRGKTARLLDLSSNRITNETCKTMAQILEGHKFSIACFSLENNAICDDGLVAMFHALKGTGLQFLDLSEVNLSSISGVVVADLISACPLLNSIQLDGNQLGDDAIVEIAQSFGNSSSLMSVNLERTQMGSAGCRALAAAIVKNRKCRQLIISENFQCTLDDIVLVLDALSHINTLERLDVSDLNLDDSENLLRALCGVMASNPKLQEIILEHNPISKGMEGGILTRKLAMELVDHSTFAPHQSAAGVFSISSVQQSGAVSQHPNMTATSRSMMSGAAAASGLAETSNATKSKLMNLSFRPNWATTIPMEHKELLHGTEDDDAEDGARPPLEPAPNSLHHPMYPGYGNGRFSNGTSLQNLTDPLPYNVRVSHGHAPPFIPSADGASILRDAPRRPLKYSPYSLVSLETNPGQLPVTEDQLSRKFQELDVDGNGYLDREEFKRIYMSFQSFGIDSSEKEVEDLMKRHCMWDDGKVTFDEFSILMLKLAQR